MSNEHAKPALIGFLPPLGGLPKTEDFYDYHRTLINTGDLVYCAATTLLAAGTNHTAWNFSASAEVVNAAFSRVIWSIPCRIAPQVFSQDAFPYELATKFIEQLEIPFVSITESIQSKGYDYDPHFHKQLPAQVVRYLKVIAEKSTVVGTRGEFSAEVLSKLGIKNVEPIGCPSLFMNGPALNPALLRKKPFSEIRKIAVAYSNYQLNEHSRIGDLLSLADENNYFFVEQTANIVFKLLYYPHKLEADDFLKAAELYGGLDALENLYRSGRLRYFTNSQNWKNFLAGMDFVFGARMHGLTPAIHSGVPAYFIAHDCRVREMCEFFKLPFAAERDLASSGINAETLYNQTDYSAAMTGYPARYRNFLEFLKKNGIQPNCDASLSLVEDVDLRPVAGVEVERNPATGTAVNRRYADALFHIGKTIVQQGGTAGFERLVRACSHAWGEEIRSATTISKPSIFNMAAPGQRLAPIAPPEPSIPLRS